MTPLVRLAVAFGGLVAAVVGVVALPALAGGGGNGKGKGPGGGGGGPPTLELTGLLRDFEPVHPDFDVVPPHGFGQYMWNVATVLGDNDKPEFVGGGHKVQSQAHDSSGRPICWTLYDPALGDTPAVPGASDNGGITSADTFRQWFRDLPGINMSTIVTVSGPLREDGEFAGMYEINEPQFYPVDDMLLGNDGAHNNFFTFEIVAQFTHDASAGYQLMWLSDDDAWVFLEDQLVADLGGINGSSEQWTDMNRLGLVDGQTYQVRFFKADRSDASSRFHLVTNIPLESIVPTSISAVFD